MPLNGMNSLIDRQACGLAPAWRQETVQKHPLFWPAACSHIPPPCRKSEYTKACPTARVPFPIGGGAGLGAALGAVAGGGTGALIGAGAGAAAGTAGAAATGKKSVAFPVE